MDKTPIPKLLLKMSPPVMLALLIQSIYNVVDSYFVSMYSQAGLTAETSGQQDVVRNGFLLGVFNGLVFTVVGLLAMNGYQNRIPSVEQRNSKSFLSHRQGRWH